MSNLADDEQTILKTALVRVGGSVEEATMEVRMFLDSGCSRTYITEKLARRLKLKMESSRMLTVNRFGGGEGGQHIIEVKTAQLTLKTLYGRSFRIKVAVTPNIMNRMMKVAISHELLCRIPRDVVLADSPFSDNREVEIEFLLGNDYYDDFVTGRRIDIAPGFRLIESEFGWITSGRVPDDQSSACEIVALYSQELANMNISDELIVETSSDDVKHSPIEDMWSLESLGITDNPNPVSDDSALEQFNKTIKFEDGRYQVTWPWRANANELPSNYDLAKRRLQTTVNRLTNTPGLMERYNTVIQDQLEKSVIEETEEETSDRVHYLPHREVLTPDKETTKLRIVYDASARASPDKPSLNDCLHRGLIFTTALLCLLMRFMLAPIVVISDIEKAFLQVGLQVHERDVTRFLWLRDITKAITPDNLVIYRFTRVAFGMSPSPFLLGATIAHHLRLSLLEIARLIERNSYVDNVITGFRTVSEAIQFYHQSKELFRQAGMNLREFASNSTEFMHSIPQVDRVSKITMKVLGIGWNIQTDMLYLNVPSTFPDAKTKRHLMQGLLKIYDPIGFVSPVIIRSRLLLQRICQGKGKRWNEALLPSEIEEYRAIIVEYEKFRNIRWPRYFGHEIDQSCRLMCFCDASKQAYATVIYLQKQDGDDRFSSRILFAKSRVCPLKSHMSIPRLELMALLIGVRGIKFIREQLAFTGRVVIWSDSQCVLKWMGSNRVQGTFVENRLREIKKVPKLEFKYVHTKDNPADLPSRGVGTDELTEFWWKGPKWSMASESEWPNIEVDVKCSQAKGELEEMSETSPSAGYEVTLAEVSSYQPPYGIDLEKFSTYESLIRVTAWCCRFHDHALRRRKESSKQLRPAELRNAEQLWLQFIQVAFSDLRAAMLTNKSHSLRNQLGTAIDSNGIIRCKGRMGAMQGSTDKRFPILLPAKNRFTKLLIERYHKICLHAGKKMTLNTVRRRFWIPHGATAVSQVIKRCVICRKVDGVGFARPQMPDLPSYRVNRTFPFEHTGLDYFGPMSVKDSTHEQPTKVWGCIFTCLTTRAIHLELVSSLAADDFLMALRRFISRRGRPRMILCDNGSQFLAVKRKDLISESTDGSPIKWQVITALSPWKGGIYERLVALVKSALKKSIGKAMLSKDQLSTLLIEIEYTLNSRPITGVDSDVDIALTPNDLLGVKNVEDTTFEEDDNDSYKPERQGVQGKIQSLFKRTRNILNAFWKIWFTDYLHNLRSTQHLRHDDAKGSTRRSPEVGEVVVLKDSQLPRNKWKLAIVQDVKRSEDKEIREVKVKLPNGTTLQRPVTLIYPLEIKSTTYKDATVKNSGHKVQTTSTRQDRPTRQAAIQADNNIKLLLQKNLI